MTDEERDEVLLQGWDFAIRLYWVVHDMNDGSVRSRDTLRMWDWMEEIAKGKVTLGDSSNEMIHKYGVDDPDVREIFRTHGRQRVTHDRDTAIRILAAFERRRNALDDEANVRALGGIALAP